MKKETILDRNKKGFLEFNFDNNALIVHHQVIKRAISVVGTFLFILKSWLSYSNELTETPGVKTADRASINVRRC